MAKKTSEAETKRANDQLVGSTSLAVAGSAMGDVADGKEVDAQKAAVQGVGAGSGTFAQQKVEELTGSAPISGTFGAVVGTYVASVGSGQSNDNALASGAEAATATFAKELTHHTVHTLSKCSFTAGIAAEVVSDVPEMCNDLQRGKAARAGARAFINVHQAVFTTVCSVCGPPGVLFGMFADRFVYSRCRQCLQGS